MNIQSYQEFMKTHKKYHQSPAFNMYRHGFDMVVARDLDVYPNNKTERSKDAVEEYASHFDDESAEYVYYRTVGGWGLPYIMIFRK